MRKTAATKGFKRFLLQHKYYFDSGLGIMGYLKYIIIAIGVTIKDTQTTLIFGIIGGVGCYVLGYLWARYELANISNEISNQYNPFVNDTLKLLSKNKKFK